jgi:subtilisin-like proprotein convertase family protein
MQRVRQQRLVRALYASAVVLGITVACTVADKDDYRFDDTPGSAGETDGGSGGSSSGGKGGSNGGTSGTSGTSGTAGNGGSSARGGTSGRGGASGSAGVGGEGGEIDPTGGTGGGAGEPGGKCGDGTRDPAEDCDDGNLVNEPCPYGAMQCAGCTDNCRRPRPPSCGDNVQNGLRATRISLQYLATACTFASPHVPLYLNGVPIPGLPWGAYCTCTPGVQAVDFTDPNLLSALRQQGNAVSLLSNTGSDYLAWVVMTVSFEDGSRIERIAYDFGSPGDAETRNPGVMNCPMDFYGFGISDGMQFGSFPVEQCDGGADCYSCSKPQCVLVASSGTTAIPDLSLAQSSVLVPQLGTIRDVNVYLNISHTYVGDLVINVRSPNIDVLLAQNVGGAGVNFSGTKFDSTCTPLISDPSATAPFSGCFAPQASLDAFNGIPSSIGPWTLTVQDVSSSDSGTLDSWSLEVCGAP